VQAAPERMPHSQHVSDSGAKNFTIAPPGAPLRSPSAAHRPSGAR
jgi:hypothetical protein